MKFTELLQQHGVAFRTEGHEHCRDGWVQIDCPYCTPRAQHWRMGYNVAGRYVTCWACGYHPLAETLQALTDLSLSQCIKLVGGVEKTRLGPKIHKGRLKLPKGVGPMTAAHRSYLRRRGFDHEEVERLWQVRAIGRDGGRLKWRLFIPIHHEGEVVSWTTRSVGAGHERRYISASEGEEAVPHKTLLYGEDYVRHAVVVVEGPTDVWRIGPGAVCTFGTVCTKEQLSKLVRYPVRYVCLDNDPPGRKRARDLALALSLYDGETNLVTLDAKDACDAGPSEITRLRGLLQ